MSYADDPQSRRLLGMRKLAKHCRCCGVALLPLGTVVSSKLYGQGQVAAWTDQDHHNVPVNFSPTDFVICARRNLTIIS